MLEIVITQKFYNSLFSVDTSTEKRFSMSRAVESEKMYNEMMEVDRGNKGYSATNIRIVEIEQYF